MISLEYQPLVVAAAASVDGAIEFRTRTERVVLNSELEMVNEILRLCDGRNSIDYISKKVAKRVSNDVEFIQEVIEDLVLIGILIDSRTYASFTHLAGNNPMSFSHALDDTQVIEIQRNRPSYLVDESRPLGLIETAKSSPLRSLLEARRSVRSFTDDPLSYETVVLLCEMAYGDDLSPVPSGGSLFPLGIFAIVTRDADGLGSGVYQYDPSCNRLNLLDAPNDEPAIVFALNSDTSLHGAGVVIVITGDLARHGAKYANRGYRYTLLEAGHVAQNIHLAAIEQGFGSLEYGGFNDEALRSLLHVEQADVWPLICVAVGVVDFSQEKKETGNAELRGRLEKALVGKVKPINWVTTLHKETELNTPFHTAKAHFKPGTYSNARLSYRERISIGTSSSRDLAIVKALAEGYERYLFGQVYVDTLASARDLTERWVDPNVCTPFTDWQLEQEDLQRFSPDEPWQWVNGEDSDGNRVYVPVDLVFYPYNASAFQRKMCYRAHSNGCAAHSTVHDAKLNAIHELIERDAIIRNWLLKEVPTRVPLEMLPVQWRKRVLFWHAQGWKVDVVNFSHSGVAILNVLARHEDGQPYMVQGSAASSVDFYQALDKAFQEMEVSIYALSGWRSKRIPYSRVDSPGDHGQLYRFDDHADQLSYLFDGSFIDEVPHVGGADAVNAFDPIYVTVSSDSSPLQVVRALSAMLVPVNFGYGRDHISHHLVKESVEQSMKPFPHYLA